MDPITAAVIGYVTKAFAENEEAKQFKDDIFGGFVKWVRPLFLEDDPAAEAVLTMEGAAPAKEKIIAAKLPKLMQDETLRTEMTRWVEQLKAAGVSEKNVLKGTDLDVKGNIHIGDSGTSSGDKPGFTRINIVEESNVKSGGDFHLGDKK